MSTKTYYAIRQRQRERQRERERLERRTRILAAIGYTIAIAATVFVFVLIGMNWATGCGETFVTYSGERAHGECVLMPWRD